MLLQPTVQRAGYFQLGLSKCYGRLPLEDDEPCTLFARSLQFLIPTMLVDAVRFAQQPFHAIAVHRQGQVALGHGERDLCGSVCGKRHQFAHELERRFVHATAGGCHLLYTQPAAKSLVFA